MLEMNAWDMAGDKLGYLKDEFLRFDGKECYSVVNRALPTSAANSYIPYRLSAHYRSATSVPRRR